MIFIALLFFTCTKQVEEANKNNSKVEYDSVKAISYGADQYGMKQYVMAFLKRGPNRDQDSSTAAELQKAHLKNIIRLAN